MSVQEKAIQSISSPTKAILTFADCAQKVLEELGGNNPMHYKEITKQAQAKGWLVTGGKTPENTMYAQVITEIKRQQMHGEQPRFVQHGNGFVGLNVWIDHGLAFQIVQHNLGVQKTIHSHLQSLTPVEFEEIVSQLFAQMGFENIEVTKRGGDGGIDVRGVLLVGGSIRSKWRSRPKNGRIMSRHRSCSKYAVALEHMSRD